MSFDMRRRSEGARKRGYLDSNPVNNSNFTNDNDLTMIDGDTNSQDGDNSVPSKAYAVHDSSLEDLDRLIMFITESKSIQGRYYVRYLPGMMNPSGEMTPCNFRPTFSFSPPSTPTPSAATTPTTITTTSSLRNARHINNNTNNLRAKNNTLNTRRSGGTLFPDVVDLTNEEEASPRSAATPKVGSLRRTSRQSAGAKYSARKTWDETDDDDDYYDDDDDDKDYRAYTKKRAPPPRAPPADTGKRFKQTARKSMRGPAETTREKSPEPWSFYGKKEEPIIYDDDDDDDDDPKTKKSPLNTTREADASSSSDEGSIGSEKQKKSINSNTNSNNASSSSSSKANTANPKWSLLDGITVTVNPDFG